VLLAFSDLHAHAWPRFSRVLPNGRNSRLQDSLTVLDQIERLLIAHRPEALVFGGDLTHRRYFLQFGTYNHLVAHLVRLSRHVPRVLMLPGNHDYEAAGIHSLDPLQYINRFEVIDHPRWVTDLSVGPTYFVPYLEGEAVRAAMREPPPVRGEPFAAFLHYAMDGVVLDHEYQLRTPLTLADITRFPQCFFGHVHGPQSDGRCTYLGAPMHFDFGDRGPRYAWLIDRDHRQPIRLTAPQFITATYPRIGLKGFEEEGFLRVLNVPPPLFGDVKREGLRLGWSEVVCTEQAVPPEVLTLVASGAFLSETTLREYVTTRYPELGDAQETMVQAGLAFLASADAGWATV
jgi:DNA repair exonuclease SbcCD nuclease subunit